MEPGYWPYSEDTVLLKIRQMGNQKLRYTWDVNRTTLFPKQILIIWNKNGTTYHKNPAMPFQITSLSSSTYDRLTEELDWQKNGHLHQDLQQALLSWGVLISPPPGEWEECRHYYEDQWVVAFEASRSNYITQTNIIIYKLKKAPKNIRQLTDWSTMGIMDCNTFATLNLMLGTLDNIRVENIS